MTFKHKRRKDKRSRRNPLAIYNPHKATLLYGKAFVPKIYGVKTEGLHSGKKFVHTFSRSTNMRVQGLPDGSIRISARNGKRLWAKEKDVSRFDKS